MRGHTWSCGHRFLLTIIIGQLILRFDLNYLERAGGNAFAAFYTVGVEIASLAPAAFVGCDLHGAYPGAVLTLYIAGSINIDACEDRGEGRLTGCDPR